MRQRFTVGGSLSLKKAFITECDAEFGLQCTGSDPLINHSDLIYAYTSRGYGRTAEVDAHEHYQLPQDWDAAKNAFRFHTGIHEDIVLLANRKWRSWVDDNQLVIENDTYIPIAQIQSLFDVLDVFEGRVKPIGDSGWSLKLKELTFSIGCTTFDLAELRAVKAAFDKKK